MQAGTSIALCLLLLAPIAVYGYASSVDTFSSWKTRIVTVCISNSAEEQYGQLFMDAIDTWSDSWSYLQFQLGKPFQDACHITAFIVKAHADISSKGHAGITEAKFGSQGLQEARIIIPTQVEKEDGSTYRVTSTSFYRIAMHEFGHAIGLKHAVDENYSEPIDIMAPILAPDNMKMEISEVDVRTLNALYNVDIEYVPPEEKELVPLPPSPTPEVLQRMGINIERVVYYTNETLTFTVTPPRAVAGISANIILYPPKGDKVVFHASADKDGIIHVEVPLQDKMTGIWAVKVSYVSWVSETAFSLKEAESPIQVHTEESEEFTIDSGKQQYSIGDPVTLQIKASKASGWRIVLLDPDGRITLTLHPSAMVRSDDKYETTFTPTGKTGTWKVRLMEDTPPVEKAVLTFEVLPSNEPDIKLQGKQIRDLLLLRLRNMPESVGVYALLVTSNEQMIDACRGVKGWSVEICEQNQAVLFTNNPVLPGEKTYFMFKLKDSNVRTINWEVYDKNREILDNGSLRPIVR